MNVWYGQASVSVDSNDDHVERERGGAQSLSASPSPRAFILYMCVPQFLCHTTRVLMQSHVHVIMHACIIGGWLAGMYVASCQGTHL
jgi:hypothetical protein